MSRSSLVAVLSLFAPLTLTGCMETMPGPERPRPPQRPVACTMNYAPVCAIRRGQQRTFSNSCLARSERWRIIYQGPCREPR